MDRRDFLKASVAAVAASQLGVLDAGARTLETAGSVVSRGPAVPTEERIAVRFLGTGAADWTGRDERGELRRLSSVLVGGSFLIDFTDTAADMLPAGCRPDVIFYTHSHKDHFNAAAALRLGVRKVYLSETWAERARDSFAAAASKLGVMMPQIIPLAIGDRVAEAGVIMTALPANHSTGDMKEQALIYLIESLDARILYAVDTGGLTGVATRLAGIDGHLSPERRKAITGLIMEATMGLGCEDDFRIFTHSSVATVAQTVRVLESTGTLAPKGESYVFITHLARTLHPTQAELDATLPSPLHAAFDGLEVVF